MVVVQFDPFVSVQSYLSHHRYTVARLHTHTSYTAGLDKRKPTALQAMLLSDVCLTSVCLSVAYIGPKSRTERPRKTKIGIEVAHVTRDSDITFKVNRLKVNLLLMF